MSYLIETYNLTKRYSVIKGYSDLVLHPFRKKEITALNDVNINVKKGELFGLLGPNGAGKTTLIKILATLILPTSGDAYVGGYDVLRDGKNIRRIIGYVINEERSFYWRLTGRQNLKFFAKLNNIGNHESEDRIQRLIDFMGLKEDADRMFKDYSTGMKQKLAIARGLITNPGVILMDEPTRSLDPIMSNHLRQIVREKLVEEGGKTVIFATHDLHEAQEICDSIAIIDKGQIKAISAIRDFKNRLESARTYTIKLKNPENGFLKIIHDCRLIKQAKMLSNNSNPYEVQLEIQLRDKNERVSNVIKKIIDAGLDVTMFYEKNISLEAFYTKYVNSSESIAAG